MNGARPVLAVLLCLAGALGASLFTGCSRSAPPRQSSSSLEAAPDSAARFQEVADFSLLERSGRAVTRADLAGEVWIAAFFFTRCAGPCPKLTTYLSAGQASLADTGARLVSISVDPTHDRPEVLTEYAARYGADPDRWWFLTGTEDDVYGLMQESFQLGVEVGDVDLVAALRITHATKLSVVDQQGFIRGYYDGESEDGIAAAVARANWLVDHGPGATAGGGATVVGTSKVPLLNACLNGAAALLLVLGYVAIRGGNRERHALLMKGATLVSVAFLASYLYYHFVVVAEQGGTVPYNGEGAARAIYLYVVLLPHVLGAMINLPMVLRTLWLAHRERWDAHRRLARWTFPLWMYVSVSGVVVYLMLYPFNPPAQ